MTATAFRKDLYKSIRKAKTNNPLIIKIKDKKYEVRPSQKTLPKVKKGFSTFKPTGVDSIVGGIESLQDYNDHWDISWMSKEEKNS